jgi:hypothetical protein
MQNGPPPKISSSQSLFIPAHILSSSRYTVSVVRMISEKWSIKDVVVAYLEVLCQHGHEKAEVVQQNWSGRIVEDPESLLNDRLFWEESLKEYPIEYETGLTCLWRTIDCEVRVREQMWVPSVHFDMWLCYVRSKWHLCMKTSCRWVWWIHCGTYGWGTDRVWSNAANFKLN